MFTITKKNTVYNKKNCNKMLIDVNTLVKKAIRYVQLHNTFLQKNKKRNKIK